MIALTFFIYHVFGFQDFDGFVDVICPGGCLAEVCCGGGQLRL